MLVPFEVDVIPLFGVAGGRSVAVFVYADLVRIRSYVYDEIAGGFCPLLTSKNTPEEGDAS